MAIQLETKDCVELSSEEIDAMAELSASNGAKPVGREFLEQEKERWVLCTLGYDNDKLKGFSFFTLDRIGGTPSIVLGFGEFSCFSKRRTILRGITGEQFKRALISFPEEDVLVGGCFQCSACYEVFWKLVDIVPRSGYDPNGEDRAWGTRLAKRFGIPDAAYSKREFRVKGEGDMAAVFRYSATAESKNGSEKLFAEVKPDRGDSLIVHGWVRKEDLLKFA